MFQEQNRMLWFVIFNALVPLGGGVGFIAGSYLGDVFNDWQYASMSGVPLATICFIIWLNCDNIPHGYSDFVKNSRYEVAEASPLSLKKPDLHQKPIEIQLDKNQFKSSATLKRQRQTEMKQQSIYHQVKAALLRNLKIKSYLHTSIGFTAVCWTLGAYIQHMPIYQTRIDTFVECQHKFANQEGRQKYLNSSLTPQTCYGECKTSDSGKQFVFFGIISSVAGIVGAVLAGAILKCNSNITEAGLAWRAMALATLSMVLFSLVHLIYWVYVDNYLLTIIWVYFLIFVALTCLTMTFPLMQKTVLNVVNPLDKSLGISFVNFLSHALGDIYSAWLMGAVADRIKSLILESAMAEQQDDVTSENYDPCLIETVDMKSLGFALYLSPMVLLIGTLFYFRAEQSYADDLKNSQKFNER